MLQNFFLHDQNSKSIYKSIRFLANWAPNFMRSKLISLHEKVKVPPRAKQSIYASTKTPQSLHNNNKSKTHYDSCLTVN